MSHQLNRSGGVIYPPDNVDPGLTQPAPDLGPHSMPVIPPSGTPGGNPDVKPKIGPIKLLCQNRLIVVLIFSSHRSFSE